MTKQMTRDEDEERQSEMVVNKAERKGSNGKQSSVRRKRTKKHLTKKCGARTETSGGTIGVNIKQSIKAL